MTRIKYVVFLLAVFLLTGRMTTMAQPAQAADSLLFYLGSIKMKSDTAAIKGALNWVKRSSENVMLNDEVLERIEKLRGIVEEVTYFDLVLDYFAHLEGINSAATNARYLDKANQLIKQWSREKSKYGRYSYLTLFRNYRLPFRNTGNLSGAIEFFSAYEKQFLAANDSAAVSVATNVLAGFYFRRGVLERGKYYMLKSIAFLNDQQEDYDLHENATLFGVSGKLNRYAVLGHFYLKEDKPEEANVYLNEAMRYFRQLRYKKFMRDIPFLFLQTARCKTKQQNDSSRYFYEKAYEYFREFQSPPVEFAGYYQERAADYISRNQLDSALVFLNRSIQLKDSFHLPVSSYFGELLTGYYKGIILLKQGRAREAIPLLEEEIATLRQLNLKSLQIQEYKLLAQLYLAIGQTKEAFTVMEKALALKEEIMDSENEARSLSFETEKKMQESENTILLLAAQNKSNQKIKIYLIGIVLLLALLAAGLAIFYRNKRKTNRELSLKNERLAFTLDKLQATQSQLIQSEKMASLGELTAGIAHEIQNPLNFVNNFSEVSRELLEEMRTALENGEKDVAREIAADVIRNMEKILHHGKRADGIVKGMLQHSRSSNGQKEQTDINLLCDEYLRLAYHGLRAKEKSFNARLETSLDEHAGLISIVPQDLGRVILNLINNAFYAVDEKRKAGAIFEPTVSVSTKREKDQVTIRIKDNGNGIPAKVRDKIFQPFFTTKPTGQGTGLGLSLSYDIVKAHGGEIKVVSEEGSGTEFIITIPVNPTT